MRRKFRQVLVVAAAIACATPSFAGVYTAPAASGVTWLLSQRNIDDGSWGATDAVKFPATSEAVLALAALNQTGPAYYEGEIWLANHAPVNVDFTARRVLALGTGRNAVASDLTWLQASQNLAPGNNGWGLAPVYVGSALDTSFALQALAQQGITTNVAPAVAYLTGAQLTGTDTGWAVGNETTSDTITTAQTLIALVLLKSVSSAVPTAITNGVTALNAKVSASSTVPEIALAVVANLRSNPTSPQATTLLTALLSQQAADGSWGEDPYATALALRALAAGMGQDAAVQKAVVNLPDQALRGAINGALGHGTLDQITFGNLQQLTTLNASGLGISNLTGLQYATNLTTLNLSNNNISSFAPIASLNIPNLNESGNPGSTSSSPGTADVPTLPEWGFILLGSLMLLSLARQPTRLR